MQPVNIDNVVGLVTGPPGAQGDVSAAQLAAAIDALKAGVDPAGDTLAELYALILVRAPLDGAALTNATATTQAPGNNSSKLATTAFTHQEIVNAIVGLQPIDALLTAISALVTSSDKLMYFTGSDTVAETPLTAFIRTLLDDADGPTALATLGALALAGGTMTGSLILNADPSAALGAATKQYVDGLITGLPNKYSALCATTTTLPGNTYSNGTAGVGATLTASGNGALTVDGQSPAAGQYVLVKNEAAGARNGLYQVTQAGDSTHPYILTRAADDDQASEMAGAFCFVESGTVNGATGWITAQASITVGATAITWTQFSGPGAYSAGSMLSLIGTQFAVSDPELLALGGLTSAADSVPYFTGSGTAALASLTSFARTLTAASNSAAARTVLGLGISSTKNIGASVLDPGTGNLEALLPIQTVTGASKVFATADLFMETRRSNAGAAMTDTFPPSSATGLVNGSKIIVTNVDATGSDTISAGSGTTISGTGVVGPGRAIQYVYDAPGTVWRPTLNTGTALLGPNNLSDLSNAATARANLGAAPLASPNFTGTVVSLAISNSGDVHSTTFNNIAFTAPVVTASVTFGSGKTIAINNSLTFAGTDGSTLNIGTGGTLGSNAFSSTAYAPLASLGAASGIATLDGGGKLTSSQIPASLVGAVQYQGTWNAGTNSPTLVSGAGTKGQYYKVGTAGATSIDGNSQWNVGDTIIFDGTTWDKIDGLSSEVISVAGRFGAVTLAVADVSGAAPLASPTFTGTATIPTLDATNINAFTLGGTISGGGNNLNNIIIGAATPLAITGTTITANTAHVSANGSSGGYILKASGGANDAGMYETSGNVLTLTMGAGGTNAFQLINSIAAAVLDYSVTSAGKWSMTGDLLMQNASGISVNAGLTAPGAGNILLNGILKYVTAPTAVSGAGPVAIGSASTINSRMKVNLNGTDYWIPVSTTAF